MTMPTSETVAKMRFYIGANTAQGFVSYAEEILDSCRSVYIIKGGPGTGKSTLMREIAKKAEQLGYHPEYYYCSSDPTSLDAVVINELGTAVTDGTSPHIAEAKYPGAREEIIDLGAFWDRSRLIPLYDTVKELTCRKKELYRQTYKYLSAMKEIDEERDKVSGAFLDLDKLNGAVGRTLRRLGEGAGHKVRIKQISSLGMLGEAHLDTYSRLCDHLWYVSDSRGVAKQVFSSILDAAKEARLELWLSKNPLGDTDGIYLPEKKTAVLCRSTYQPDGCEERIINTERFIKRDALSSVRSRLRFLTGLENELYKASKEALGEIKNVHFALEEIYKSAMDFSALEAYRESLSNKIF